MSKELKILEGISKEECLFKDRSTIYMGGEKVNSFTWKHTIGEHFKGIEDIKQALQRLEQIDNANPSEALEWFGEQWVEYGIQDTVMQIKNTKEYDTIKQALIKAQEQEKVLKIMFTKTVSIFQLSCCKNVDEYNDLKFNDNEKLAKDEFDLLKEVLK